MTFPLGEEHVDAPAGSFLCIPAAVTHDFENHTSRRAGVLNVFIPAGFEQQMPAIVARFAAHPEGV